MTGWTGLSGKAVLMNIEVLINIVIVFIIVASALKRMREVTAKSREITKPPTAPTVVPARAEEETASPRPSGSQSWRTEKPEPGPMETRRYVLRDILESLNEAAEPEENDAEAAFEQLKPSASPERIPASAYETAVRPLAGRNVAAGAKKHPRMFGLEKNDVTKGIVMSEILGPPVSLRQDRY